MAVTANIHEAKTTLSKLIERALAGEEVVIAKAGKPLVRLNPVSEATETKTPRRALFGSMREEFKLSPDWDSPATNAEIERLFYESEIFPDRRGFAEE
ncbi:type II toxin-antitoxin system Phd/YefM family antitoxin [Brevundimonas sp. UBA7534]|uniref:type II toxin-antitoxin system Phd/YefM family antitoxin n=1 Tax=Brevundimonas sp. UBA7534 TaxID=1946138 RepID=UPI0025C193A4|nr:type II toxin-antitoxin system prevent-host-death family antitoxin [Brevundimonas sp. UBA7534]